eukprot:4212818-Pleurochrysis_carterae.AAC.2
MSQSSCAPPCLDPSRSVLLCDLALYALACVGAARTSERPWVYGFIRCDQFLVTTSKLSVIKDRMAESSSLLSVLSSV